MIDMSTWEELVVDVVDELHLDPHNVRIEQPAGVPEADIIQDLFSTEKAFALVEGIVKIGLLTHEVPIVVRRNKKLVVVEGNRRVAALKAIQNPYLAPEYQARITRLTQTLPDLSSLRKITVKRAPNQDNADQLIAALHTGNQRVPWGPTRQAAFFQAQIDAGKTPEQLIAQYPTVDVKKFIVRSRILNLFRSVKYRDPALVDYVASRRFPVSTLARLYDYDKFLQLAQIEVDDPSAEVVLNSARSEFTLLAEKIIRDIRNNRINTRTLNRTSSDSYKEYMDELRDLLNEAAEETSEEDEVSSANSAATRPPSGGGGGGGGGVNGTGSQNSTSASSGGSEYSSTGDAKAAPPEKPKKQQRNYLNTEQLQVPVNFPESIRSILTELSGLNIRRFPNAALDLIRTFLEKTIKSYAEVQGEEIKKSSNEKGYVFLSNCLIWLEQHVKDLGLTAYIQVIAKIRGGKVSGYVSSMDHLNAINHNHLIVATPEEVRECWTVMEGLLKVMLKP